MKKSPWFRVGINPARVGWYEFSYDGVEVPPLYWDGEGWRYREGTQYGPRIGDGDEWRGLAEKA
jgi:hypothetical protein